jgi:hypothetical protein
LRWVACADRRIGVSRVVPPLIAGAFYAVANESARIDVFSDFFAKRLGTNATIAAAAIHDRRDARSNQRSAAFRC